MTVRLLAGGNPQIAKGEGPEVVAAYIAAVPGWKQGIVAAVDALIEAEVRGLRKAVKWNSPLYGTEPGLWFASIHCFTDYVKLAFFRGAALDPVPPGVSRQGETRYLDIPRSGFDAPQLADWLRQAAALPGVKL